MAKTLALPSSEASTVELVVFDFDGVFTDNTVWTNQHGEEMVRCWRGDGLGLAKLRALGISLLVLSTETNPVVAKRCEKLQLEYRQGLADKALALQAVVQERQLTPAQIVYVGNDINDIGCLQLVGVSIVVADADPAALAVAKFQTKTAGGFGAVREVCDWLAAARTAR